MDTDRKVIVDAKALREILTALQGPPHLIRELIAISNLQGHDCPIKKLVAQFNRQVRGSKK